MFFKKISRHQKLYILVIIIAASARLLFLDRFPVHLYSDEVNQGYNAYSILKTAHDEHGVFMPFSFRSFGDWKPPLPTYIMVPTIGLFGFNPWGIRLPGALLGFLTIPLLYLILKELQKNTKQSMNIPLLAAFLLAISPWHIHQSRMAMLTAVALFFHMFGIYGFLKALSKPRWFVLSAISFVLCIYSYYGMRVIVPLTVVALTALYFKKIVWKNRFLIGSAAVGLLLLVPLLAAYVKNPDVVVGRAKTVSVFYDQGITLTLWERIAVEGSTVSPIVARFFHNKLAMYADDILRRFISHIDTDFLLFTGDKHLPFQLPNMGVLYFVDALFIVVGISYAIKEKMNGHKLFILWAIISIIPASLTFLTPAANRSFNAVVPAMIFVAYGIVVAIRRTPKAYRAIGIGVISLLYFANVIFFMYQYAVVLPRDHADWWLYGTDQVFNFTESKKGEYEDIIVSPSISMPYIYLAYYTHSSPQDMWKTIHRDLTPDRFGFEHVSQLGGYWFPRDFSYEKHRSKFADRTLLVTRADESVGDDARLIKTIYYPNGISAYTIYDVENTDQ